MTTASRDIVMTFPVLHEAQRGIRYDTTRYRVLCCGRRFGKTLLITDEGAERVALGQYVAYFNLSYKQGKEVWEAFKKLLAPITARKLETERRIETITGGVLEMWSLDNEETATNALGRKYHMVMIDEAARVPNLMKVWDETIAPMLMDFQGGAFFVSTPRGKNDFHTLYQRGLDPLMTDWQSFHYPTSANPHILASEIEKARLEKPDRAFRQEILAEFTDDGDGVFRGVSAVSTITPRVPYKGRFVFGVDWARDEDFTVVSVMDINTRTQVYMERFNQIGWAVQRGRISALAERWKPERIVAETNSIGSVNIEALRGEGLPIRPFTTTAQSKGPLIDTLTLLIEREQVHLLNDPVQKAELQAYSMERLPSGTYRYSAPSGGHDDTVMALALACKGLSDAVPTQW